MKKIIFVLTLSLFLLPLFAGASFSHDLYYGMTNNSDVKDLQTFLSGKGFFSGQSTGNFFSLTMAAVKKYQASKNIITTGRVGPLTRQAVNNDLAGAGSSLPSSSAGSSSSQAFSGTLDLSISSALSNQSISVPQTKFELADFTLKNNTTEPINVNKIEVDLTFQSLNNSYISNLYIVYGNNTSSVNLNSNPYNYWAVNFQLPAGGSTEISLLGDISSLTPLNSKLDTSMLVSGVSSKSSVSIYTNSNAVVTGQSTTLIQGSLNASKDNSAPVKKIVSGNQRVVAGIFNFASTGDSYVISELKFVVPGARNPYNALTTPSMPPLSQAVLLDSVTQNILTPKPAQIAYDGNEYFLDFSGLSIPVGMKGSQSVAISYDLSTVFSADNTNNDISPVLVYMKASNSRGVASDGVAGNYALNINAPIGGIPMPATGVTVNSLYVCRSMPIISAQAPNTTVPSGSRASIYTFNVSADKKGDVAIKQLNFTVTISDPNNNLPSLTNFLLFKNGVNYTSSVLIGANANNNYVGMGSPNGIGIGTNNIVVTFIGEDTIPAGTSNTYTLKAETKNFFKGAKGTPTISTFMPSDSDPSTTGSYLQTTLEPPIYGLSTSTTSLYAPKTYNLIWSDKSSAYNHSFTNGSSSKDWYNGFGVSLSSYTQVVAPQ